MTDLQTIRDVSLAVTAFVAAGGALTAAGAFLMKAFQWVDTQVDRARKVTALVAEVPLLAAELTKVSTILNNLVNRFDAYVSVSAAREKLADEERTLQAHREDAAGEERLLQVEDRSTRS